MPSVRPLTALVTAFLLLRLPVSGLCAEPENPWRRMFDEDHAGVRAALEQRYIYAKLPDRADWAQQEAAAEGVAQRSAPLVNDPAGYRAALEAYLGAFADPHLKVTLYFGPATYRWPGFLVRFRSGAYRVVLTQTTEVKVGDAVIACDERPVDDLVAEVAAPSGLAPTLAAVKIDAAVHLLLDDGSPLRARPKRCQIGGRSVSLDWKPIVAARLAVISAPFQPLRDDDVRIEPLGRDGAWVRLGSFFVTDAALGRRFHAVIDAAPRLRGKRIVVLDVRGNRGGDYNWFMVFLRAFYGAAYADHFARARLEISPAFVTRALVDHPPINPADFTTDPAAEPADPEVDATFTELHAVTAPGGERLWALPSAESRAARRGGATPSPVRAKVYVLTDAGCASACLAFVDEVRRIPGVVQIGGETFVDRRSGTPVPERLPSGSGTLSVPNMVRLGRARGENVPWRPDIPFDGDIADTAAVKRWVLNLERKNVR